MTDVCGAPENSTCLEVFDDSQLSVVQTILVSFSRKKSLTRARLFGWNSSTR